MWRIPLFPSSIINWISKKRTLKVDIDRITMMTIKGSVAVIYGVLTYYDLLHATYI